MEPSGLEPLPPACHEVAKRLANACNYKVYESILTALRADIRAELSKHFEVSKMIKVIRV